MKPIFSNIGLQQAESIPGKTAVSQERIIVNPIVGILLTTVLLLSVLMIALVTFHTRLSRRPLNLPDNPVSTVAVASLVCSEPVMRALFDELDQSSEDSTIRVLGPYSIIPTLLAVSIKIWWESIDQTFRRLQPYVSMARNPTESSRGPNLTYINSPSLWAAGEAVKYRHWLFTLVASGAVFAEICQFDSVE